MENTAEKFGSRLREWRGRRRLSQLALALESDISTRHLSFIETGRAQPSREMVLRLAKSLGIPLRERNLLLVAAGFAPISAERPLSHPALEPAADAVRLVLAAHEPWPALAIDRHWNLIQSNRALMPYLAGCASELLEPPTNVLRISLHPAGMGSRIINYGEWRDHILARLRRSIDVSADPGTSDLADELAMLPSPFRTRSRIGTAVGGVLIPLILETAVGIVSMFSTTTVFGTPLDVTLEEVAIEAFFPADDLSADRMRKLFAMSVEAK
ncbi:MAG: transcriptional regulator [Alphaproteobacteria bacterium]|nr:transcriptional regulator [Alphaproteobacteria bacterium]